MCVCVCVRVDGCVCRFIIGEIIVNRVPFVIRRLNIDYAATATTTTITTTIATIITTVNVQKNLLSIQTNRKTKLLG